MNTANIKKYAPQARADFIAAITQQANKLGIFTGRIEPLQQQGEVAIIGDQVLPASVIQPRQQLIERIQAHGFEQTMDYIAYSWFNRLCAIRYLEVHDFLSHGFRVLSSADGSAGLPQILENCVGVELPGLSQERIAELKLAGNQDEALYRELLLAQCRDLNAAMPLLFEPLADDMEWLLPDNLTKTDSLIRELVRSIPEEDWANIEIIGWLYQFYISAKKDQVIGKVVKTEDIPAATQLFTPNWIVKYLVQNSVGRLWSMANPTSMAKTEWEYYIQPAEQVEDVQNQLNALIQKRIAEDGIQINPESITVLDPACGSGHILVEAYDCLKAMYLERGYSSREIPRLILEKNLYGIDIDERAAQLASFALLMKAREDDRRLLRNPPKLNIIALQETGDLDVNRLWADLNLNQAWKTGHNEDLFGSQTQDLGSAANDARFKCLQDALSKFEHAKTFGSLICMDASEKPYAELKTELEQLLETGDTLQKGAIKKLLPLLNQAIFLAKQYDAVIANPPYMGSKGMNSVLKAFAKDYFPDSKSDLFAMFIERGFEWCKESGFNSMVTMQSWMFLSSYETMREKLLTNRTLSNMVHMGNGVMGIAFGTAATIFYNHHLNNYEGSFSYCENDDLNERGVPKTFPVPNNRLKNAKPDDFKKIPGSPIAYWVSAKVVLAFDNGTLLGKISIPRQGNTTTNNGKFVRDWYEVDFSKLGIGFGSLRDFIDSQRKWCPYNKGGGSIKWFGLNTHVVNWENDGFEIRNIPHSVIANSKEYFKPGVTFSTVSSSGFGFRSFDKGFIFDNKGASIFIHGDEKYYLLALLNSKIFDVTIHKISPTLSLQPGDVAKMPILYPEAHEYSTIIANSLSAIKKSRANWDSYETSWDFTQNPMIRTNQPTLEQAFNKWQQQNNAAVAEMKRLEEENNKLFIDAYGLQDELTPDVPDEQITLTRADREKDTQRLVSYAIGCMMGRYSLDEAGLIYAHAGNEGFDPNRYQTFKADDDGIIPLTEMHWFEDDATRRIQEFLSAVWGKDTLNQNMLWLADGLAKKNNETPEDAVRRYLSTKFYKDHLQTYKKRPIYWLFSSGKLGAFQALVYLHRYNESTLARMRTEYVMPLISKMSAHANTLEESKATSTSAADTKHIDSQLQSLNKQQAELSQFEEKLRHLADQRISLDLDDGVKVNYGKFGDLLAEVKAITGGKE